MRESVLNQFIETLKEIGRSSEFIYLVVPPSQNFLRNNNSCNLGPLWSNFSNGLGDSSDFVIYK